MIVQIYEIGDAIEAKDVAAAGVDHVGVLVGNGEFPREIKIADAKNILVAIPLNCRKVVLTLSRNLNFIEKIVRELDPDILHLATVPETLSPQDVKQLKSIFPQLKVMRSIPVTGEQSIDMAKQYSAVADFLLLDSHKKKDNQVGATGLTHDWSISKRIVELVRIPIILAGGLGPENVAEAIRIVRPAGVDSKTKTDKHGEHKKDIEKVKLFVENAKST
jgi:phosphoribosylanthranilate isomerase